MLSDAVSTTPMPLTPFDAGYLQSSVMGWQIGMLLAQRQQLEMMAAWQRSIAAVQRELIDQWICRFGGGVPLDG